MDSWMTYSYGCPVGIGCNLLFRFRIVRRRVVVHDQTRAALARQECPHPLDENADSEIGRGQQLDMDCGPGEPGKESAQMDFTALQNGKAFAHNCHVALIEVAARTQRRLTFDQPPSQLT